MKDEPDPQWLRPAPVEALGGDDRFAGLDATVADFWSWAFSDLRANTTRGVLAEFLVAKAVGATQPVREAWDNYDVLAPDGTRIEVKSSAYLQSWTQSATQTSSSAASVGSNGMRAVTSTAPSPACGPTSSSSPSTPSGIPMPTTRSISRDGSSTSSDRTP